MPIPQPGSTWPPTGWATAYQQYATNSAWLTGDIKQLRRIYNPTSRPTHQHAGTPHTGGLVGTISRAFWGRPTRPGENRTRHHLPIPADLATLASDLQYATPPTITPTQALDDAGESRVQEILGSNQFHATLNSMGEIKAALGAVALIPRWDTELADHVWIDYAPADTIIPVWRNGILTELTLWSEHVDGHVYWRHLEHHAPGYIEHALYRGTATNLGQRMPLQEHPATASYAELVDSESRIPTGITRLTAAYLVNAPALAWRNNPTLRYAGRSDFNQVLGLFDAADEAFSSWMRDLKLGQGRIIVPEAYLRSQGPGTAAAFDTHQELFVGINTPGDATKTDLTVQQFNIRVEQHEQTLRGIMREILRKTGYSMAAWGDPDRQGTATTATEINARNEQTERTRQKKNLYDRMALRAIGRVALELDSLIYPGKGSRPDLDLRIEFPDTSRTDPKTEAETIGILNAAGAISTWQKVARANPDWSETQIAEEIARLQPGDPVTETTLE